MGFNEFEGDLVRLRAIEPEDWEVFNGFDLDTQLARLCASTHLPASKASSREWAEECSKRRNSDEGFLVIETLDGAVIGSLNVVRADRRNRVYRYGLGLHRQFWRKGYGTEAVNLLLRFYFGELGYHKVEIDIYSYNDASVAFHEQLASSRRAGAAILLRQGEYHDVMLMGMTPTSSSSDSGSSGRSVVTAWARHRGPERAFGAAIRLVDGLDGGPREPCNQSGRRQSD